MSRGVRRVVTGHDAAGKAVVTRDEVFVEPSLRRPGQEVFVAWTAGRVPADNRDDFTGNTTATVMPEGVAFRVVRYAPGGSGRMHRTDSLDFGVVLEGSITLEMEGAEVVFHAGDLLVQRGTLHRWTNHTAEPCTIVYVLIGAAPLS